MEREYKRVGELDSNKHIITLKHRCRQTTDFIFSAVAVWRDTYWAPLYTLI